jgi:hypothetical protein
MDEQKATLKLHYEAPDHKVTIENIDDYDEMNAVKMAEYFIQFMRAMTYGEETIRQIFNEEMFEE